MLKRLLLTGIAAVALLGSYALPASANWSDENLRYTRYYVEQGVDELNHDQHDYNGHRVAAIAEMQAAREDIVAALASDRVNDSSALRPPSFNDLSMFMRGERGSDANMRHVRWMVSRAITILQGDQHDYNGFRVKAIGALQAARNQINLGLRNGR